ncbi:TonB family protein [Brevundimonas fontaquae]|uniref:TonB family protein n=1 Tax=Brevundimonas fontaquae TaxID=2813778 RepID=A0ABX7LMY0_9CAUL|nr:TonB family protein [Brevundimonas fontaquae]QSF53504.1 TonB family protein [Brevundimonas fontaquae]
MSKAALLVMTAGLFALSACASPPVTVAADGTPVVGRSFTPDPEDGSVTVECTVAQNGTLSACIVISETPPGQGFGQAALNIAQKAKLTTAQSRPGGKVRFTTRFRLAD